MEREREEWRDREEWRERGMERERRYLKVEEER